MRYVAILLVLVPTLFVAATFPAVDAQDRETPLSVEQRLVRYFDNDADAAVQRVLRACDAIQERVYAGVTVHVRDELIQHVMAIEEEDIRKIVDRVKPDILAAGMQVEYVIKDATGQVLTEGVVGAESDLITVSVSETKP